MTEVQSAPTAISLRNAGLTFGKRRVWQGLDIAVRRGEFIAVLGPNGSGKTSLLQVLLGLQPLSSGAARIQGAPPTRGNRAIGYIPQQKSFDPALPLRGRDLVRLGVDGHEYGFGRRYDSARIERVLRQVGAADYADMPLGVLSGGEQQRLRVAQALIGNPAMLFCDEPLLSLDVSSQQSICRLIHEYRQETGAPVVFVTHEINPVLPFVDRILYLANGRWVMDVPEKILQSAALSELYGTAVDVIRVHGHVHVIADETDHHREPKR